MARAIDKDHRETGQDHAADEPSPEPTVPKLRAFYAHGSHAEPKPRTRNRRGGDQDEWPEEHHEALFLVCLRTEQDRESEGRSNEWPGGTNANEA